jgi:L-threonylcarbamoyladenylate synthase
LPEFGRLVSEGAPVPIMAAGPPGIARAVEVLRAGGTVVFPTETVYGLGGLAFDRLAVARIFEIKRRPCFDPLIVHVLDRAMLERVAFELPPIAETLAERFWPGGLTLVLRKRDAVPDLVTAGAPTVAIRVPSHPVARAVLAGLQAPIAAPSANPFGGLSPTRAEHVAKALGESVDLILDGGRSEHGLESTIVGFDPGPALLRPGAIPVEAIEAVVGPLTRPRGGAILAPGRLPQHYAPQTRLRVIDPSEVPQQERKRAAALTLRDEFRGYAATERLSPTGDLRQAAARFFEALHALDAMGLERIDAQPLPEGGLGLAMMDRLRRAAASG